MNNRLFAIGDIHGCFDSFQKLIEDVIDIMNIPVIVHNDSGALYTILFGINLQHKFNTFFLSK